MPRSALPAQPPRSAVELDHAPAVLDRAPQRGGLGQLARAGPIARPVPVGGDFRARLAVADQQQPAGQIDDVGERLDHALAERRRVGPGAAERRGEAQPFGAIIVAMLEQMLGQLDLEPGARARARQEDHQPDGHRREHGDEDSRSPIHTGFADRRGDHRHEQEIAADREQAQRLEAGGARHSDSPAFFLARGKREQGRGQRHRDPAPVGQPGQPIALEIADGVVVEVVEPHRRQPEHRVADVRARGRRGLTVEIVDQHQRARRRRQPKQRGGAEQGRAGGIGKEQGRDQLQADHRGDRAIDQAQAALWLLALGAERVEQGDPHQVAEGLGIAGERAARLESPGARPSRRSWRARPAAASAPAGAPDRAPATTARRRTAPRRAHGPRRRSARPRGLDCQMIRHG